MGLACDSRCGYCSGPTNDDCLNCVNKIGIIRATNGSCVCQTGYSFAYDSYINAYTCICKLYIYK